MFIIVQNEMSPWERAQVPSINLSESVHASWLSGEGGKKKISLYDACVSDVLNSYIQCAKRLGFMTGRFIGTGPSMESMLNKAANQRTQSPSCVAKVIGEVVARTPMYEEPTLHGDKETVQRKKKSSIEAFSSHRPEVFMESRQRKPKGRPRHIHFDDIAIEEKFAKGKEDDMQEVGNDKDTSNDPKTIALPIQEVEVPRERWALRRMPANCVRKCFGRLGRKNCNALIQSHDRGLVAPSIWSERTYQDKSIAQWLWFCNHDVEHTRAVKKQVIMSLDVPDLWPIARGTNVSDEELSSLRASGFKIASVSTPLQTPPTNICTNTSELDTSSRKRKWRHGISKEAQNRIEAANKFDMTLLEEIVMIHKRHVIFRVMTENVYDVHIKEEPGCTCPDFQKRECAKKSFGACKHMYFVYVHVLGLQPKEHLVIHQPVLTVTDLAFVLAQPRKIKTTMGG